MKKAVLIMVIVFLSVFSGTALAVPHNPGDPGTVSHETWFNASIIIVDNWWPIVPCGTQLSSEPCTICHLWIMGSNIANFTIWIIAMPVSVIMFVVAGLFYIIAGGNQNLINKAHAIFTTTLIGLVIVFSSWLIVDSIFKTLANGGGFVGAWNETPSCQ